MTQKSLICLLMLGVCLFTSCADDDNENSQNNTNYFPLATSNSWNYQNTFTSQDQDDMESEETLTVTDSSEVGGNTLYEFETSNPLNAAPTTNALSNGSLYKQNSSLIYNGAFGLGLPEFPELNFEIQDGKIYDKNASAGTELFAFSDTLQESIEGAPILINYTITSVMNESFEVLEVNNEIYEDVISSTLNVNMVITTEVGIPPNFLEEEEVVEVTNYFAKDVGLIQSETDINFKFITFPTVTLDDFTFQIKQDLQDYNVNIE